MNKKQKIMRKKQREYRRKMKQETTFDVEAIQHEIYRVQQQHMHSNEDQQPQQQNDNSALVSAPVKTPYHEDIQQQQEYRLQPSSDLFQTIGGETVDREHI
jgi:hypothetical protein